jgi:hypothetical protein
MTAAIAVLTALSLGLALWSGVLAAGHGGPQFSADELAALNESAR